MTKTLTRAKYSKLISDVRKLIEEGKANAEAAVQAQLVQTYWQVGKRISQEHLTDNSGYFQSILEDLSEELLIDVTTLIRSVQFFQTYSTAPRGSNINWAKYKVLLPIQNEQKRKFYEDLAVKNKLTRDQLVSAVKSGKYEESKTKSKTKTTVKRPTTASHVYKAYVERVIDGDTLLLKLDLGFAVFKEQRLRLASIDCPSMDEDGGREVFEYVRDTLAGCEFVMVKTSKIDIYGRYVGDVFYSANLTNKDEVFSKGVHLNGELVKKGYAQVF